MSRLSTRLEFRDKSGIFTDFGFKLVVINALLDKETSFSEELEKIKETYVDTYDGGEDIYFLLMTDWDGESDEFAKVGIRVS